MMKKFRQAATVTFASLVALPLGGCATAVNEYVKVTAGIPSAPNQEILNDSCIDRSVPGQTAVVVHDGDGGYFAFAFTGAPPNYVPITGQVPMAGGIVAIKTAYDNNSLYLEKVQTVGMEIDYYGNNPDSLPSEYKLKEKLAERISRIFHHAKAIFYDVRGRIANCLPGQYIIPNPSDAYPRAPFGWDEFRYVAHLEGSYWRTQIRLPKHHPRQTKTPQSLRLGSRN